MEDTSRFDARNSGEGVQEVTLEEDTENCSHTLKALFEHHIIWLWMSGKLPKDHIIKLMEYQMTIDGRYNLLRSNPK